MRFLQNDFVRSKNGGRALPKFTTFLITVVVICKKNGAFCKRPKLYYLYLHDCLDSRASFSSPRVKKKRLQAEDMKIADFKLGKLYRAA